ncbi:Imidazolonepropionase [Halarsenatibacter silvermanii]|uniref:Imidazolonepropionase n=1 Tax=Halarsenatibacter silvermanii TaxID=321763 RepID=A0A1G9SJV1_9FIRM|nr:Imidazolonepropionase [Halarsenatibacter silvermanii]
MQLLKSSLILTGSDLKPLEDAAVLISKEGEIVKCGRQQELEIPDGTEVIDHSGKIIMPGLIDAHVHLCLKPVADPFEILLEESPGRTAIRAVEHARKTLKAGVTTVRDMSGKDYVDLDLRDAVAEGNIVGPRILASGKNLAMTGGHGWPTAEEVDGPAQARRGARKQIKEGADQIKIMATGGVMTEGVQPGAPQMTEDEMRAAIEEAHKADRKTAAHAQGTEGIKNALRAGIDSIEHGIFLDEKSIKLMKENEVFLVPTLAAPHWISEKGSEAGIPEYAVKKSDDIIEDHQQSFQAAYQAGVKIALGTDAGTPFNEHGKNTKELKLMVENGMTPQEALTAATSRGAELLGISAETGSIEPGCQADLLVLEKNPLEDIENIETLERIYLQGSEIIPGTV